MSLSIGIVGLPNVGKSTLFNALTNRSVPAENYPFCTIDPCVGVVAVPDERLEKLARLSHSAKTIPAAVEFTDIAGLVAGASKGEGLGNQFLSHIRETDAIAEVVRVFHDADIIHVAGEINPLHDIEVINLELVLADFATVSKRRAGLVKEMRGGDKNAKLEDAALAQIEQTLDQGRLAASAALSMEEKAAVKGLGLLTMKPILYVLNTKDGKQAIPEDPEGQQVAYGAGLASFLKKENARYVTIDAAFEQDIMKASADERPGLRNAFGISESALDTLIRESYALLGLITFFTTGPDETRGWTIQAGTTVKDAGAAIHTDFRDKFIRAEVVFWKDLVDMGGYPALPAGRQALREKGLVRTEGKEYLVKDGDVIEFKI